MQRCSACGICRSATPRKVSNPRKAFTQVSSRPFAWLLQMEMIPHRNRPHQTSRLSPLVPCYIMDKTRQKLKGRKVNQNKRDSSRSHEGTQQRFTRETKSGITKDEPKMRPSTAREVINYFGNSFTITARAGREHFLISPSSFVCAISWLRCDSKQGIAVLKSTKQTANWNPLFRSNKTLRRLLSSSPIKFSIFNLMLLSHEIWLNGLKSKVFCRWCRSGLRRAALWWCVLGACYPLQKHFLLLLLRCFSFLPLRRVEQLILSRSEMLLMLLSIPAFALLRLTRSEVKLVFLTFRGFFSATFGKCHKLFSWSNRDLNIFTTQIQSTSFSLASSTPGSSHVKKTAAPDNKNICLTFIYFSLF